MEGDPKNVANHYNEYLSKIIPELLRGRDVAELVCNIPNNPQSMILTPVNVKEIEELANTLTENHTNGDDEDENMSGADSSGDTSDGENGDGDNPLQIYIPPEITIKPCSSPNDTAQPPAKSSRASTQSSASSISYSSPTYTSTSNIKTSSSSSSSSSNPPPLLSPLVYQTPQGMMYAQSNGSGVLFSLAQTDPNTTQPQFITIPLSMVATNGQGELDLSKRKTRLPVKDEPHDAMS
ncbi:hypothetical protein HHI36_013281 [Cryptolaemus montrouzieri]|uniref:Uncharacterized protein n=1 Tax=Cryptolaemus montrouzieri TaxID=559131 RepID=A0ABD2NHT2_9CUCU